MGNKIVRVSVLMYAYVYWNPSQWAGPCQMIAEIEPLLTRFPTFTRERKREREREYAVRYGTKVQTSTRICSNEIWKGMCIYDFCLFPMMFLSVSPLSSLHLEIEVTRKWGSLWLYIYIYSWFSFEFNFYWWIYAYLFSFSPFS